MRLTPGRIGLAVFSSEGCGLCRALEPAVDAFGRDPRVALRRFDEVGDAGAWAAADVPGSPFAVALDADGTVLAKGTFNTGAQLESVLAAAERAAAGRGGRHWAVPGDGDRRTVGSCLASATSSRAGARGAASCRACPAPCSA